MRISDWSSDVCSSDLKGRDTVKHSTKKPWRQKGTGRARSGMTSSPIWRGGGRAFPNSPEENFSHKVNKKMYRAGIRAILSQLAREDRIAVVDTFALESDRKSTRMHSSHKCASRMPSAACKKKNKQN